MIVRSHLSGQVSLLVAQARALFVLRLRQRWSYRSAFFLGSLWLLIEVLIVLFLAELVEAPAGSRFGPGQYFGFAAVGGLGMGLLTAVVGAAPMWVREGQLNGTLEPVLCTPASETRIASLVTLASCPAILTRAGVQLGTAALLGAPVVLQPGALMLTLLLCVALLVPFGLVASASVLVFKRAALVSQLLVPASMLLAGVYFPRDLMPAPLQWVAELLPSSHVLDALRGALLRGGETQLDQALLQVGVYALVAWPVGICALAFAARFARLRGTLLQY